MFGALARRLFGSANDRYIKSLGSLVAQINEIEPELEKLSDEALRARTAEFKQRLAPQLNRWIEQRDVASRR